MTRLTLALLAPLFMACGEGEQDSGAADDIAACGTDVKIVSVCKCDLTLDWSSSSYSVTWVRIDELKISALEMQEAACYEAATLSDLAGSSTLVIEDDATELLVDALDAPALVGLFDSHEVVATVILDPDAAESTSTVVFE